MARCVVAVARCVALFASRRRATGTVKVWTKLPRLLLVLLVLLLLLLVLLLVLLRLLLRLLLLCGCCCCFSCH